MSEASTPILKGDLKALTRMSIPLMLFLFCESLTSFCVRNFLSYHSINSIHACVNAEYLAAIFQTPCLAIAAMALVFVGYHQGKKEFQRIGPCVWQLIWFSFLSFLITFPISFPISSWYFRGTVIEEMGVAYFMILAMGNFLFPLTTALSAFYLGRGKTLFVTSVMLANYALQLLVSWVLIFGIAEIIPALGARGSALAKCIRLGLTSCIFFGAFLTKQNRALYNSGSWRFSLSALWHYMTPGFVRALGYFSSKVCWVATCYVLIQKGGRYLDVVTIGGTVISFLLFTADGIYKAMLAIASNLMGAEKSTEIWRLCRSLILYAGIIATVLAFPLLLFPDTLIFFLSSSSKEIFRQTFKDIHYWIWLYMLALTIQMSFCALLVTFRELKFQLYCYLFVWPLFFSLVYFGIGVRGWQANKLWFIMACENIVTLCFFYIRVRQASLEKKQLPSSSQSASVLLK